MNDKQLLLVPLSRKEIAAAMNISYTYLWKELKEKGIDIPKRKKVFPNNIILICDAMDVNVQRIIDYVDKYNLRC
jgi:DNA-binding Xre family transcriptional regulator